jgi:hypothetical protein
LGEFNAQEEFSQRQRNDRRIGTLEFHLQKSKKTGYFVTLENKNLGNMQFVNIFCIFVALFDYSILFYF